MIDTAFVITIALMCGVTYLTRIVGYLALRNRTLSPRLRVILEAVPGCVLISSSPRISPRPIRSIWPRWALR